MKKTLSGKLIFSPSDLIRYMASPFASWMSRYALENPNELVAEKPSEDAEMLFRIGNKFELSVLGDLRKKYPDIIEIERGDDALKATQAAIETNAPVIYQAKLRSAEFEGYADLLILDDEGYEVWDVKLSRSLKPYFAVQLCCYAEMLAETTGKPLSRKFGIILGTGSMESLATEDFIHYYRNSKANFLDMQRTFTNNFDDRPEPTPRADHAPWNEYAKNYFEETDHMARVARITSGQIKKFYNAGITTLTQLAGASGTSVKKLSSATVDKIAAQARLQHLTMTKRRTDENAKAEFEIIPQSNTEEIKGLAALPNEHPADVFFDMEGYPLFPGGLEYLFGVTTIDPETKELTFRDWWAHDRLQEKAAFEAFVDWVYARWQANLGMHIYHYAPYEVTAMRKLSNGLNTRVDQIDQLLRNEVFVDLYKIVRGGIRIGEDSYSIKRLEQYYRGKREGSVANAIGSVVQYNCWIESGESPDWKESEILSDIRDYNKDDCDSTAQLAEWLRGLAAENGIAVSNSPRALRSANPEEVKELKPNVAERLEIERKLYERGDTISKTLGDLIDFHRREAKPIWWKMFELADAAIEELHDDDSCIAEIEAFDEPVPEKRSLLQSYRFDPAQECKLSAGKSVKFTHELRAPITLFQLDVETGTLQLKATQATLDEHFSGKFPLSGSLIMVDEPKDEPIPTALARTAEKYLNGDLPAAANALLNRIVPSTKMQQPGESTVDAAIRITSSMNGGCLVIQGPPGTGKTYTASHVIDSLLAQGKTIGVASNSHKAIVNLLTACGKVAKENGSTLRGIKVGGSGEEPLFSDNPEFKYVEKSGDALETFSEGIVGGTAWLFTRPEWEGTLDFLFIDEAGQVSLANLVAMSACAKNLVLLGDQMQLEQPVKGSHPGDSRLSGLQYALKDVDLSIDGVPIFHAVVPSEYGLFLGESFRMHPAVCGFISESIYEGRLSSHLDCQMQKICVPETGADLVTKECGIIFSGIEHEGNPQQSAEEVERVLAIYHEMIGRPYTNSKGVTRPLTLDDFLFVAPYNAQVRALSAALPERARVGSVDKFQGQEAPVCILSLCSSYGEYGGRGLKFILDRNRINVAVSRAQCLAIVVADPRIADSDAGSIEEMKLLNLFCKFSDYK